MITMIQQPPFIKPIMIIKMSSTIRAYLTNIDFNLFDCTFSLFPAQQTTLPPLTLYLSNQTTFNSELDENNLQTERY